MTCKDSLIYDLKIPGIVSFAFRKLIFNRCKYLSLKKGRCQLQTFASGKTGCFLKKRKTRISQNPSAFINVSF